MFNNFAFCFPPLLIKYKPPLGTKTYGGLTLVIHIEGAMFQEPPHPPECLKATLLPPHRVDECPKCHPPYLEPLVLTFMRNWVPTVKWYISRWAGIGGTFTQNQGYTIMFSQNLASHSTTCKTGSATPLFMASYGPPLLTHLPSNLNSDQHQPMSAGPTPPLPHLHHLLISIFLMKWTPIEFAMINAAEKIVDL